MGRDEDGAAQAEADSGEEVAAAAESAATVEGVVGGEAVIVQCRATCATGLHGYEHMARGVPSRWKRVSDREESSVER